MNRSEGGGRPIVVDGELRRDGRLELDPLGGALHHAHGLFETLAGGDGTVDFLTRHLARLARSSSVLGLPTPAPAALWREDLAALFALGPPGRGLVRLLHFREGELARRVVAFSPDPAGASGAPRAVLRPAGGDFARPLPAHKSFAWLGARHARAGLEPGEEVLFVDGEGRAVEAATANVLAVRGDLLHLPGPESGALAGVGREVLAELASAAGLRVRQAAPLATPGTLALVSSARGLRPLRIGERGPDDAVAERLRSLAGAFEARRHAERERLVSAHEN